MTNVPVRAKLLFLLWATCILPGSRPFSPPTDDSFFRGELRPAKAATHVADAERQGCVTASIDNGSRNSTPGQHTLNYSAFDHNCETWNWVHSAETAARFRVARSLSTHPRSPPINLVSD
jgi:hypothetical protein